MIKQMSFQDYSKIKALNFSRFKCFLENKKPEDIKKTQSMIVGSIVHEALLEPLVFKKKIGHYKVLLTKKEWANLEAVLDKMLADNDLKKIVEAHHPEQCFFNTHNQTKIKSRIDGYNKISIFDLKTIGFARNISKNISDFLYVEQLAFYAYNYYLEFKRIPRAFIIFIEVSEPYDFKYVSINKRELEVKINFVKRQIDAYASSELDKQE